MATAESTARRKANEKAAKKVRRAWRASKGIWPMEDPDFIAWLHILPCVACYFQAYDMGGPGTPEHNLNTLSGYIRSARLACFFSDGDPKQGIEAAHIGDRGNGQTCSDREACPLCKIHHDRGSKIGHHQLGKNFWSHYGIPKAELILWLNALYDELGT